LIFAGCSRSCDQSQALMTAAIDGVMTYKSAVPRPVPHPSNPGEKQ
jgi:hypothetical protein